MWISKKRLAQLEAAASRIPSKNYWQCDLCRPTPKYGYVTYGCILSDHTEVRFLVPNHAWNKLAWSKKWKAFQALLEKCQEEYIQMQHQIVEGKSEN